MNCKGAAAPKTVLNQPNLYLVWLQGFIHVTLHRAVDLEKKDFAGKSDPYAIIRLGCQLLLFNIDLVSWNRPKLWKITSLLFFYLLISLLQYFSLQLYKFCMWKKLFIFFNKTETESRVWGWICIRFKVIWIRMVFFPLNRCSGTTPHKFFSLFRFDRQIIRIN